MQSSRQCLSYAKHNLPARHILCLYVLEQNGVAHLSSLPLRQAKYDPDFFREQYSNLWWHLSQEQQVVSKGGGQGEKQQAFCTSL